MIVAVLKLYFNNFMTWSEAQGAGALRACLKSLLQVRQEEKMRGC